MTNNKRMLLSLPPELHEACEQAAGTDGLNAWIRRTLAKALKRPQLADLARPRGRPKKDVKNGSH